MLLTFKKKEFEGLIKENMNFAKTVDRAKKRMIVSEVNSEVNERVQATILYINTMAKEIAEHFNLDVDLILQKNKKTRKEIYLWARNVIIYNTLINCQTTYQGMGRLMNMDHSTIIHTKKMVENYVEQSKGFKLEGKPQDEIMNWYLRNEKNKENES